MDETFVQGLTITVIGMTMVFAALALMWALIAGLTRMRLPARFRGAPEDPTVLTDLEPAEPALLPTAEEMAAIATALALLRAEQEAESGLQWRLPPTLTRWAAIGYSRGLSPWQPPRSRSVSDPGQPPPGKEDI